MTTLTLALFDMESLRNADEVGGWENCREMGFSVGVVKFVNYRRDERTREVCRWTLCENVHFSAAAFIDDLLRPWADVIVAKNGWDFDIPVAVSTAVPEVAGPYVTTSSPYEVAAVARTMREVWQEGYPMVGFQGEPEAVAEPSGWWGRRMLEAWRRRTMGLRGSKDMKSEIGRWMSMQAEHSQIWPAGVAALTGDRERRIAELRARCFDPQKALERLTGHPHVCTLDDMREGLTLEPFTMDGKEVDHADLPRMFREGLPWDVVEVCRNDVKVLEELMHQALGGNSPRIFLNRMRDTMPDGTKVGLRRYESPVAGKWKYHVPTAGWWEQLEAIAEDQAWRLAQMDANRRRTFGGGR